MLNGEDYKQPFNFLFSCQIKGADESHSAQINFEKSGILPNRVIALIGKNGTGKTQYLSRLAVALSGQAQRVVGMFEPHRPPFSKVIAVSYSMFDHFVRPKKDKSFSYKYCGLKDQKGFMSQSKQLENFKSDIRTIENLDRVKLWYDVLNPVLGKQDTHEIHDNFFIYQKFESFMNEENKWSSGHSILMHVITQIMANIHDESLILFDEPEMHLHPNAIANITHILNLILEKFDSYAILATHSPIIVQQIPSDKVLVFEREGNVPRIRRLDVESFGENITSITQDVFEAESVKPAYQITLEKISNEMTYSQALGLFEGHLSFNAKMYLKNLYK